MTFRDRWSRRFRSRLTCPYPILGADEKTRYAVIRCLEIVGEAVKRIPEDFQQSHPDIPWKSMAGTRDRLIHGYDVVDSEIVWITSGKQTWTSSDDRSVDRRVTRPWEDLNTHSSLACNFDDVTCYAPTVRDAARLIWSRRSGRLDGRQWSIETIST